MTHAATSIILSKIPDETTPKMMKIRHQTFPTTITRNDIAIYARSAADLQRFNNTYGCMLCVEIFGNNNLSKYSRHAGAELQY